MNIFSFLFNIAPHEWKRVSVGFLLRFTLHAGYVIGWTVITARVVIEYGILYLPLFYVANALLTMFGMFLFSELLNVFSKAKLSLLTSLLGIFFLFTSSVFYTNGFLSLICLIIVISICHSQLLILLQSYLESIFSPLENQRALPVIDTGEPIAGIIAGGVIAIFVPHVAMWAFYLIWAFFLFAHGLTAVFRHHAIFGDTHVSEQQDVLVHEGIKKRIDTIEKGVNHLKAVPFVRYLLFFILFQWTLTHVVEFQYTKAIHEKISHSVETIVETHGAIDPVAALPEGSVKTVAEEHQAQEIQTHTEETGLAQGLGSLYVLFSILVLFVQIFFASRVVSFLGIISSLRVLPFISFLNTASLLFHFGFFSAVIMKAWYEATLVVHTTAYHNVYYVLFEAVRDQVREFIEGFMRPLGIIVGVLILFAIEFLFGDTARATFFVNLFMVVLISCMAWCVEHMNDSYTQLSRRKLSLPGDHPEKLHAIEIMSQHGHKDSSIILSQLLTSPAESDRTKMVVLRSMARMKDFGSIPAMLTLLSKTHSEKIMELILRVLSQYKKLGAYFYTQAFTRHHLIHTLTTLFETTSTPHMKSLIIRVFAQIQNTEIVPFLITQLDTQEGTIKADIIQVIGQFNDASIISYIEPYCTHKDARIRSAAIGALWQFKHLRLELIPSFVELLDSKDVEEQICGIELIGKIHAVQEIPRLLEYLENARSDLRRAAAFSLAHFEDDRSTHHIHEYLISLPLSHSFEARQLLDQLPASMRKIVEQYIIQDIHAILSAYRGYPLETLDISLLEKLKFFYEILDQERDISSIDQALDRARVLHQSSESPIISGALSGVVHS